MSPHYVLLVMVDGMESVHGSYHKQARAEEDAARIRRGLKGHHHEVRVMTVRLASVANVRHVHGLDEPVIELIPDANSPTGFRVVA